MTDELEGIWKKKIGHVLIEALFLHNWNILRRTVKYFSQNILCPNRDSNRTPSPPRRQVLVLHLW